MADEALRQPVITLRPATPNDLALLRRWDEQPHVLAADPNDDWGWEAELHRRPDWREQPIAKVDARPIGFVQIIDPAREESRYWGDVPAGLRAIDLWIGEAACLGKGYGTSIMRLALARCFADTSVTAVLVDPLASNTRAHRFYERRFPVLRTAPFRRRRMLRLSPGRWSIPGRLIASSRHPVQHHLFFTMTRPVLATSTQPSPPSKKPGIHAALEAL